MECAIALAEGFTNAVRHAHKHLPPETPIDIHLHLYPQHIELRIWDCGPPFDLGQHLANLPPQPDYEAARGRGLLILSRVADQLDYQRLDDCRNCLSIVKYTTEKTVAQRQGPEVAPGKWNAPND